MRPATEEIVAFIAGFVAAEGTFIRSGQPPKHSFAVSLGAVDSESCDALLSFFGTGHVHCYRRRKPHYDDEVTFAVQSLQELVTTVIPFMDEHLPPSYKREQYLVWRERLLDYWEHRAKRVRQCAIDECDQPRRAHGLCRRHLYVFYGT